MHTLQLSPRPNEILAHPSRAVDRALKLGMLPSINYTGKRSQK
jgi:hypothetical protein